MSTSNFINGAAIDTRTDAQKLKDHRQEEVVAAAAPVNWVEKPQAQWRRFPDQEQNGSGSCVAQTVKKLAGINHFLRDGVYVDFSATTIYQARSNKPAAGMQGIEAFELWRNEGVTLEQLVKSQQMSDAQMDALKIENYEKEIAKVFKIGGHVGLPEANIESVASTIQATGKGIMTWFYFTSSEWSRLNPQIEDPNLTVQNGLRHSVAAVDFFLFGGKKAILIEDSAHFGGFTYRVVTEDFFKARNWFARYPLNYKFDEQATPKPHYNFTKNLEFSAVFFKDPDVVALQDILKYEGFFPLNSDSTGYFGSLTLKAVQSYQVKHGIVQPGGEGYGLVGPRTRAQLNADYN